MRNLHKLVLFCITLVLVSWISERKSRFQDPDKDLVFVRDAASSGIFEVTTGKLVVAKATNGEIKAFAQKMVKDHGKANQELLSLVSKKNMTVPDSMDPTKSAIYNAIALQKGKEFDQTYVNEMVKAHDIDVSKFEENIKTLVDADIKAWAAKTLPVLKMHQHHAHQLQEKLTKENSKTRKEKSKERSEKAK